VPHSVDWIDEDRRILAVRLYDPITAEDIDSLQSELTPIVETGQPLYILVDIGEVDLMQAYTGLGTALEGLSVPSVPDDQWKRSRVAVIGGGMLVNTILSFLQGSVEEDELIRAFKHEDKAFTWLDEESRSHFNPSF
jgi:hypothetical protein